MADGVQVRGCCCGIPFGCGTVLFFGTVALWVFGLPDWFDFLVSVVLTAR